MTKHGAPDWSKYRRAATTFSLEDLAEHAVRLGALSRYDRRGDVVFQDDFSKGLARWQTTATGTGAAVALDPTRYRSGLYSVKITSRSDTPYYSSLHAGTYIPVISKVGVEFSFMTDSDFDELWLRLYLYYATELREFDVRYDKTNENLDVRDRSYDWQNVASDLVLRRKLSVWHTMKMVVDLNTHYYTRLLLDDNEHDISAYRALQGANGYSPNAYLEIYLLGIKDENNYVYVDDVIFTQDEP